MVEPPSEEETVAPDDPLYAIERMMAQRVSYDQVTAALDALAPGDDPEAMASVAHTRLTAASMYQRGEAELVRAIEVYLAAEPVMWRRLSAVLAACVDSPELFRRHVEPLIAEAEAEAVPGSDTPLGRVLDAAEKAKLRLFGPS